MGGLLERGAFTVCAGWVSLFIHKFMHITQPSVKQHYLLTFETKTLTVPKMIKFMFVKGSTFQTLGAYIW